ncbi:hypothetical protein EBZ39_01915 [bacterium]|nr:hypothetical protein [bacterium]
MNTAACQPKTLSRTKLIVPTEPAPFIPPTVRICKMAELMVHAEMLKNDIMPSIPVADIGTDCLTQHWDILKRVQIKGQEVDLKFPGRLTFSTRRRSRAFSEGYEDNELDAFVFVHTELRRFFIVPANRISPDRHKITFGPNSHSQWEGAWWVLKKI